MILLPFMWASCVPVLDFVFRKDSALLSFFPIVTVNLPHPEVHDHTPLPRRYPLEFIPQCSVPGPGAVAMEDRPR